tara:strand:- start:14 stop:406 length:393 start_codon:yes stop_codon:yes gene_type:complete
MTGSAPIFVRRDVLSGNPLLSLIGQFRPNPREEWIDLSMVIYGNAIGYTPVMAAEAHPIRIQVAKGYAAPEGDADFLKRMVTLVFDTLPFAGVQPPAAPARPVSRRIFLRTAVCAASGLACRRGPRRIVH